MGRTYLDWASAAPVHPKALEAFKKAVRAFGNPSAPHAEGRAAKQILEESRTAIARMLEVKSDSVIFTSGATEANALAIQGVAKAAERPAHMLYLPTAHSSVVRTMEALAEYGISVEPLIVLNGAVDITALKRQLRSETILVSMDAVCGETGTRYDTRAVRRALGEKTLLHVDASQLPLVESFELERLKADLLTLDAQKVGGLRGIGVLAAPRSVSLLPVVYGGGQERGLRSGSEPHALAAAFAAALIECQRERTSFALRAGRMRATLRSAIAEIPGTEVNVGRECVPHIINVSLRERDTDYLVALLDEAGYAVSTKSACETDAQGSRVVAAMFGDPARAAATLRISFGPTTSEATVRAFAAALARAVSFLDRTK